MDKKKYTLKQAQVFAKDFIQYLQKEKHIPIADAYVYGSYAKKKQHAWSDIDIAIVSAQFSNDETFSYLGKFRRDKDIRRLISPIGIHPQQFKGRDSLLREIKKHGVKI